MDDQDVVTQQATGVTTTSNIRPAFTKRLSSWNVVEQAAGTAQFKIRDTFALPDAPSAAEGAAGNGTAGLHMFAITWVTAHGESFLGSLVELTIAASKKAELTNIPVAKPGGIVDVNAIVGRRVYETKAGAPGTGVTPTSAQWFRVVDDFATTCAAGMAAISLPQASITVASTTGFAADGNILVTTTDGIQVVKYTSVDATHFLGCTGGSGLMTSGGAVSQPAIGDNTKTTFSANVADASLVNTRPSTQDKAGPRVAGMKLAAGESVDVDSKSIDLKNGGGPYMEIVSGTVDWVLRGN